MRVLSGIKPTGLIHWGNYFGAIRQYIALQDNDQAYYFIANLHALTTVRDRDKLRGWTLDIAIDWLALGLSPSETDEQASGATDPRARNESVKKPMRDSSVVMLAGLRKRRASRECENSRGIARGSADGGCRKFDGTTCDTDCMGFDP